ncbi:MAG: SoxR reducing system RseC family protein [Magnetococcales bacterium]|nr:SoxR reducing system RseC family protein [Magnetococcales bacterium]
MLREEVLVVAVDGLYAIVSSQRKSACGSCHAEASCSVLSGGKTKYDTQIRAMNPIGALVGQRVELEISEQQFLKASFLVYVLPIIYLLFFGVLARHLAVNYFGVAPQAAEGIGGLAGVIALVLTFFGLSKLNSHIEGDDSRRPVIRKILTGISHNGGC